MRRYDAVRKRCPERCVPPGPDLYAPPPYLAFPHMNTVRLVDATQHAQRSPEEIACIQDLKVRRDGIRV